MRSRANACCDSVEDGREEGVGMVHGQTNHTHFALHESREGVEWCGLQVRPGQRLVRVELQSMRVRWLVSRRELIGVWRRASGRNKALRPKGSCHFPSAPRCRSG